MQDKSEISVVTKEKDYFHKSALMCYLLSIQLTDADDLMIFRVVSYDPNV